MLTGLPNQLSQQGPSVEVNSGTAVSISQERKAEDLVEAPERAAGAAVVRRRNFVESATEADRPFCREVWRNLNYIPGPFVYLLFDLLSTSSP